MYHLSGFPSVKGIFSLFKSDGSNDVIVCILIITISVLIMGENEKNYFILFVILFIYILYTVAIFYNIQIYILLNCLVPCFFVKIVDKDW